MTQDEIKRLDRRIRLVQEPFGTGFPSFYRLLEETSQKKGESKEEILRQLVIWKTKSCS